MVELEIDGLGHEGEGVGRFSGFTLFVPGALPAERVRARVTEVRRNFGRADLAAVLRPGPDRVEPPCPVYAACGGCQLQHLAYPAQLRAKTRRVQDALERIGRLTGVPVHPTLGMADPWHYRNKAQFPVGLAGGRLVAGPYAAGSHRIVEVDTCLIQHPTANAAQATVVELARSLGVPPYDESTHTGVLRHVLVRVTGAGLAMVILVTNGPRLPQGRRLTEGLIERLPEVVSVWQNINSRRTNVALGEESILLAGGDGIIEEIEQLKFRISPRSFLQVNPIQVEILYGKAVEYLQPLAGGDVVDVYCGIGTISLLLLRAGVRHVYGVEEVPEAVADARANAALNGYTDAAQFLAGPAERLLPQLQQRGVRPDAVVFDPPRRGCDPAVLAAAAAMAPRRLVYVSCNPTTLARDLGWLQEHGYRTVQVQPVDMFPHTAHVECVAQLEPAAR